MQLLKSQVKRKAKCIHCEKTLIKGTEVLRIRDCAVARVICKECLLLVAIETLGINNFSEQIQIEQTARRV